MNSVISFSLFGSAPLYTRGAIVNAERYPKLLPGWQCVFFVGADVPQDVRLKLKQAGAEVREPDPQIANGMFWRFTVLDDSKVQRAIFRDTDSRPSQREAAALSEWEKSARPFWSCRDHPHHSLPLGGGLWGYDRTKAKEEPHFMSHISDGILKSRLAKRPYKREDSYSLDQTFLTHFIWPIAKRMGVMEHDTCNRLLFRQAVPFPIASSFDNLAFMGEIIDAQENPNWNHRFQRLNYLKA